MLVVMKHCGLAKCQIEPCETVVLLNGFLKIPGCGI
jgi:hypothetical protein